MESDEGIFFFVLIGKYGSAGIRGWVSLITTYIYLRL